MSKQTAVVSALLYCLVVIDTCGAQTRAADVAAIGGIELWLDAEEESARRGATDASLERWGDRSGRGHHALQPAASSQPHLVHLQNGAAPPRAVVRFDGRDDHLRILNTGRRYGEFTLFVVAAADSDHGGYRGFFAVNEHQRRDYESGFTLDMNAPASAMLTDINFEGRGFGGARNLLNSPSPFGSLHVFEAVADADRREARLVVDGQTQRARPWDPATVNADEMTVGARHYTNGPVAQQVRGFLDGDIAEVLLFDRVLDEHETERVRAYLTDKHRSLKKLLAMERELEPRDGEMEPLVIVSDPPPVQMLIPGFSVRELPVELTNVNNVRYRADGKLYALGYNGNISLLSDRDGDGLEDSVEVFFQNQGRLRGPIGMAVIPAGHALLRDSDGQSIPSARGVVVASKGKVSAILDLDGDDVAEQERVIASGWQEIPQNVDAVAVAIDPADGAIFFALGTAAFNNAYLLDQAGNSSFDLNSVRGTVQRIAPDLSERSTVCTGVRFLIGMEFDEQGELFATDQEGATWLANGNPFDELLHIRPGLHYGFPPRHPRHLPNVFDQPSLFDFRPQHQSTCGMTFNLPRFDSEQTFGPEDWRGDLLITGESRGKLYRTELVRDTEGEYIARNRLIGCLSMLTVDCCLTPGGDLLVACHSGGPDWGTGPEGIGRLFQIRYYGDEVAQPVDVWAGGPREVRIAFDRPIDPTALKGISSKIKITGGRFVEAADRFESIRPGYSVTQYQQSLPRYRLPVYSVSLAADRQTLILATAEHRDGHRYALTMPGLGRASWQTAGKELPQQDEIDLAYSLTGVEARWTSRDGASSWSGWLPHLDLDVAMKLLHPSAARDLNEILERPGKLVLETSIDTRGLFTPAIQPGSKLDYDMDEDRYLTSRRVEISLSSSSAGEPKLIEHDFSPHAQPRPIQLTVPTGAGSVQIRSRWKVDCADGASHSGSLALHRFLLPWVRDTRTDSIEPTREIPQLANASWGRGRRVFLSDEAGCAKCHVAGGSSGDIGPDLSNLIHRDYASVHRDITQPSYAINPDFITYTGVLADGRVLTGALKEEAEQLIFGDKEGRSTKVHRDEIVELKPSTLSVMPDGIAKTLGPEKLNDLLAFLLMPPPTMPLDSPLPAPPPRGRREVAEILRSSEEITTVEPINILLVAGKKDHGPGEHDYPAWLRVWSELLMSEPGVTVETAMEWPTGGQIAAADTIAFFQKGSWTDRRAAAIDRHLAKGGGLIYIHWAVEGGPRAPEFAKRIGLASYAAELKYRHGPLDLDFRTGSNHPIGRNFDQVHFYDESYWQMKGDRRRIRVIGTGIEEGGNPRPLFWTFEPSAGRVFVSIPGHYSWTFDDPLFRVLLLRGIAWTARQPVDRFNGLVTLGIELRD